MKLRRSQRRFLEASAITFLAPLLSSQSALGQYGGDPVTLQKQAIEIVNQYRDRFRQTGDRTSLLPRLQQAEAALRSSYTALLQRGDPAGATLSAITAADTERMQQRMDPAFALYSTARDLAKKTGMTRYEARALNGMAQTDMNRGNLSSAMDEATEALRIATAANDKDQLFSALDFAADIEMKRGNYPAAADYLDRALALKGQLSDRSLLYYGLSDRSDVYLNTAEKCDYQREFEPCYEALKLARTSLEQALAVVQELGFAYLVEQTKGFLRNLDARQALIKGQEQFNQSTTTMAVFHPKKPSDVLVTQHFSSGADPRELAQIRGVMQLFPDFTLTPDPRGYCLRGQLYELEGDNNAALNAYKKAVDLLEQDRRKLRDDQSRGSFLEDKIDIYYKPILLYLELHRYAEAFTLMEASRSRAMTDLLASRGLSFGTAPERELYSQSVKLRESIAVAQRKLTDLLAGGDREKNQDAITRLQTQIDDLKAQDATLQNRIAAQAPKLNELMVSKPETLAAAQRAARAGNYDLLYYLVLEHAVILWHISGDQVQVLNVFLPRPEVIRKSKALLSSVIDPPNGQSSFDEATSRELFLFLIQPVLKSITTRHLIILPHDELNSVPFQLLQNPADGSYLGERFQISYAPSTTVLAGLEQKPNLAGGQLLAIGTPSIHVAAEEVQSIGRYYPNHGKVISDAPVSKDDLKSWVSDYNLVHLSVHGAFDVRDPLLSYLEFRPTPSDNGHLTAAEMFGLPLQKSSMVVLSACETGRIEATHANEVLGIVRALLYAGASNLVLSGWQVDAKSTELWMETFYREGQTKTPGEAARLALLSVKSRPEYRHPYFWAPFMLTGR